MTANITLKNLILFDIPEQEKYSFIDSTKERRYYQVEGSQIPFVERIYIIALVIFEASISGLTQFQHPHLRSEWRQGVYGKREFFIENRIINAAIERFQGKSNVLYGTQLKVIFLDVLKDIRELSVANQNAADSDGLLKANFSCLDAIQALILQKCRIRSLPINFNSHTQLLKLDLSNNYLSALPDTFCDLSQLQLLNLSANQILLLPEEFGRLNALTELSLSNNRLTTLPDSFVHLQNLRSLDLRNNQFNVVPECLFQLHPDCTINVENNPLTPEAKTALVARMAAPGYNGPVIRHTVTRRQRVVGNDEIPRAARPRPTRTYETELADWCAGDTFIKLKLEIETNRNNLHDWLSRLKETKDYRNDRFKMMERVRDILDWLAAEPDTSTYREQAYLILSRATATCGDRIALSINDLSVLMKVAKSKDLNLAGVKEIIIGMERYYLLTKIAYRKCEVLFRNVRPENREDVEVHLLYQTKLKEPLKLPLEVDSMLYSAHVTETDLQNAKMEILNATEGSEKQFKILMESEIWKVRIEKEKDFQDLKEKCEKEKLDYLSNIDSTDNKAVLAAAAEVKQKSDTIWNPVLIYTREFLQRR